MCRINVQSLFSKTKWGYKLGITKIDPNFNSKAIKKKKSDEVTAYQIGGRSSALVTAGLLEGGAVQLPKHKEGNQDEDQRYCKLYSLHSHTKVSYCK